MNDLDNADELDGLRQVLKPAQERVLAEVAAHPDEEFTRADYETLAHVSPSQAAYDLAELIMLGLVERFGSGRATHYRVVRGGAGRRRMWTSERIRTELSAFCDELGGWPRASEFKEAGRGDLYLAASRYGGIDRWAEELGYYEDEVPEPSEPESGSGESELRRWVPLAGTGLATLAALAFLSVLLIGSNRASERSLATAAPLEGHDATARPVVERGGAPDRPGVLLRLVAASGDSSLVVRRGSADGRLLWEGILERGESVRFRGRLWLSLGAPGNLVARLNGDRAALPRRTSTARVTASGIRVLSVAQPAILASADTGGTESAPQAASSGATPPASPSPSSPSPDPAPGPGPGRARAPAPRPIHPQEIEHGEDMGIRRPSRRRSPAPARSGGWPG